MEKWIYLIIGGTVGTVSRFVLAGAVAQRVGTAFPWGTLAVNLAGCFVIGFLDVIFEKKFLVIHNYRILLMTGFCGAFTTLSSVMLETSDLLNEGKYSSAIGNIVLTICVGFIFFKLGSVLAEQL